MHKEEIREIAKIAAIEAINHKDDVIREEFDTRYKDVKLLMRNYRKLKTYYDRVEPETLEVNAICSMRRKTGLMMSHVDKMLIAYQALCQAQKKFNPGLNVEADNLVIDVPSVAPSFGKLTSVPGAIVAALSPGISA